jgi:hypothetical protein
MPVPVAIAKRLRVFGHQQASPRSNPRRVGAAFCAESCEQGRQKRIDVGGRKTEHHWTDVAMFKAFDCAAQN